MQKNYIDKQTIFGKIDQKIIAMGFTADVTQNSNFFEDLYFDDLDLAELVIHVEAIFNIKISNEEIQKLQKVSDLCCLIESKIQQNQNKEAKTPEQQKNITKQSVYEQLVKVIRSECIIRDNKSITPITNLRYDLDLTSLDIVDVCIVMERLYNIRIEFLTENIETVQQLCDNIYSIIEQKHKKSYIMPQTKTNINDTIILQKLSVLIKNYCENNPDDYRNHSINKPITLETKLKKKPLKLDNTDIMQLSMEIDKEFGIYLPQQYIDSFRTVEDIVKCVHVCILKKETQKIQTIQKQR
ncbi:MAG: hypothetical protein MJ158_02080 [Alphaproteobacteria bacterium]|nr:hypothetical protein [Alphaproteobacteria bacterium]